MTNSRRATSNKTRIETSSGYILQVLPSIVAEQLPIKQGLKPRYIDNTLW